MTLDWDGWKRRDWDGQRLLELFHEFGFRGFAERVRKTLADERREEERRGAGRRPGWPPRASRDGARPTAAPIDTRLRRERTRQEGRPQPLRPDRRRRRQARLRAGTPPTADGWRYDGYELVDTPRSFDAFLGELKKQKRFVFDLETTGLEPDLRTRSSGYAFCWEAGRRTTCRSAAPTEDATLDPAATLAALKPIFENPTVAKVNQNIKYDQLVLAANGVDARGRRRRLDGRPLPARTRRARRTASTT